MVKIADEADIDWAEKNLHPPYKDRFVFPDLSNSISNVVLKDDGKIIGFACLRNILEAVMMLSQDPRERAKAIPEFINLARYQASDARQFGFYSFVQDPHFAHILKKKFGFVDSKGQTLFVGCKHYG